jgi:hypothetical protein
MNFEVLIAAGAKQSLREHTYRIAAEQVGPRVVVAR